MKDDCQQPARPAKDQSAKTGERPSGDGVLPTDTRAWGRRSAPRGHWVSLNDSGVAAYLSSPLRYGSVNNVERLISTFGSREAERRRIDKARRPRPV